MVYVLLGSETEDTYSALFAVIRNILPLNYDRTRFVTDYERALMNAVRQIFPNCDLLCCWFHYTQVIPKHFVMTIPARYLFEIYMNVTVSC